jgi:hypothetical protein
VDPGADATFRSEGPEEGVGAVLHWSGEGKSGSVRIVKAEPARAVECEIDLRDGAAHSVSRFQFVPDGTGTRVTWKDEGSFVDEGISGYFTRLGAPMMQSGFGNAIEASLGNLKTLAEGGSR